MRGILFGRSESRPVPGNAAEWVVRMRSGSLDKGARGQIQRWMNAAPDNARELLRAEAAWRLSGLLENDTEVQHELAELDALGATPAGMDATYRWRHALPRLAYAAATIVLAAVGIMLWLQNSPQTHTTLRGEQRVITLADNSTITLNTDTRLQVKFSAGAREITLQRGEALFQVARDAARPFIVYAGRGTTRAVGTRFNVLALDNGVTVSVLEGRVEVTSHELPRRTSTPRRAESSPTVSVSRLLDAGESVAYAQDGELLVPEPAYASPERIAAWSEGKLRFDAWPLDRAVREYNRYVAKPIRLDSPAVADLPISGVFRVGDAGAFVAALRELVDGQVVDDGTALRLTGK